ncbi:hypothetical protein BJV78DRAFT_1355289 [Lactifluus subvellereus]|nr:hypothetical protein BJV78DRAFT_1355289 [Lactifluus subvellereus]
MASLWVLYLLQLSLCYIVNVTVNQLSKVHHTRKPISHPSMSSRAGKHIARHRKEFFNEQGRNLISFQRVTIGSLPDNVLLDIFDFYLGMSYPFARWCRLVQVCRRWRYVVFASPCRLGLAFLCKTTTPVREILDVWPPMQIVINDVRPTPLGEDNIIAALEHPDRVPTIYLRSLPSSLLDRLATSPVMQESFPVLTYIQLEVVENDQTPAVLPDTFLGGSAPRLQTFALCGIPFPALPKLLLSARDLVNLWIWSVPHTGYISPEAVVTWLPALTNLKYLVLGFQSPSSRPDRGIQRPPPLTRVDLPALARLSLQGVSEYVEDFLVRINTPVLTTIEIEFFNRVNFDIPQLFEFVSRTEALRSAKRANLVFTKEYARLYLCHSDSPPGRGPDGEPTCVGVRCHALDWQISFLVQICSQLLPHLSSVERLDIGCQVIDRLGWQDDVDYTQWLEIFRPFIAVQSLHIFSLDEFIAPVLQELTGVTEVLPALRSLFLTDPDSSREAIEPFITARHLSNQPVTVVHQWEEEKHQLPAGPGFKGLVEVVQSGRWGKADIHNHKPV